MAGDKRATHNVTFNKNRSPNWSCSSSYINGASDIVKLTCEYDGMTIVATQPIIVVDNAQLVNNYKVSF